jgi:hypothetical protein
MESDPVALLEKDLERLRNSVEHLLKSNDFLQHEIEASDDADREYKSAIEVSHCSQRLMNVMVSTYLFSDIVSFCYHLQENIVVIAKQRGQIERLEKEIDQIRESLLNNYSVITQAQGGGSS